MWRYYVRKYKSVIWGMILALFMVILVVVGIHNQHGLSESVGSDTFSGKAMGTVVKKTIYSNDAALNEEVNAKIDDCLRNLENQISVRVVDSEVSNFNRNYVADGIYRLSESVLGYLKEELIIWEETEGAFSPCIRPLTSLWAIEEGQTEIPEEGMITESMKLLDASNIEIVEDGVIFHEDNMAIDFGAAGKGIACDYVIEELEKTDIDGAVISIGGSIAVYGSKGERREWHIGIRDPRGEEDDIMGVVVCEDNVFVSTSGDYEKYFEVDGKRYHHIIDPSTGYPADRGLISVTIISESGFLSDALSTACFVMGLDDGMKYAQKKGVEAVFITEDRQVYVTKGIKKSFNIKEESYTLAK